MPSARTCSRWSSPGSSSRRWTTTATSRSRASTCRTSTRSSSRPATASSSRATRSSSCAELSDYLAEHARRENYALLTSPQVQLETDDDLDVGVFGIATRLVQTPGGQAERGPRRGHTMIYKPTPARCRSRPRQRRRSTRVSARSPCCAGTASATRSTRVASCSGGRRRPTSRSSTRTSRAGTPSCGRRVRRTGCRPRLDERRRGARQAGEAPEARGRRPGSRSARRRSPSRGRPLTVSGGVALRPRSRRTPCSPSRSRSSSCSTSSSGGSSARRPATSALPQESMILGAAAGGGRRPRPAARARELGRLVVLSSPALTDGESSRSTRIR